MGFEEVPFLQTHPYDELCMNDVLIDAHRFLFAEHNPKCIHILYRME
jgi:hypothetical protein